MNNQNLQDAQDAQDVQDPQDTAELSSDMAEPKIEQQELRVKSVYEGLVRMARTHGKLYRTNGRRADMVRFDLTTHSVFVGNAFIVHAGVLKLPVLETAALKVDMTGLPWLTEEEQRLDPLLLFREHYLSRPNGSEKYMSSNFLAKDIDEMTDDEIAQGMPRGEARVRLEAWILCASLDGTLERYVRAQPNWREGSWWWSPVDNPARNANTPQLVIKTNWWRRDGSTGLQLQPVRGGYVFTSQTGKAVGTVYSISDGEARAMQVSGQLARLARSLAQEAFHLQMRAKCYDIDPVLCEVNRLLEYIDTGKTRNA